MFLKLDSSNESIFSELVIILKLFKSIDLNSSTFENIKSKSFTDES